MSFCERRILPRLVNRVCGSPAIGHQRRLVVPKAKSRVLEIGFASGLNLAHHDRMPVEWTWGLEQSAPMDALAAPRMSRSYLDVRLLDLRGEDLPLSDKSVDTVVVTCQLHFCEHGAGPDPGVRRWQGRVAPLWTNTRSWRQKTGSSRMLRSGRAAARNQVMANASTTAPRASSPSPAMNTVSA